MSWRVRINSAVAYVRRAVKRRIAALWRRAYRLGGGPGGRGMRYDSIAFSAVLILLVLASLSPTLRNALDNYYATEQAVAGLRDLILNTGSALIGATAIVTSLVLFAMQVNVERMPHGLFRRLSADGKLLGAFAVAFLLAIAVAALPALANHMRPSMLVFLASGGVLFILVLFLWGYRRALALINPLQQLDILVRDTRKELRSWARCARRVMPSLEQGDNAGPASPPADSTHDLIRTVFFKLNARWDDGAKRAVRHAMSFARRYAEQGDYEVSEVALKAVFRINAEYIKVKGKTFYTHRPIFENPLTTDGFINDTLEHLRQHSQAAITRRDEQQIEQTLRAMAALIQRYLDIDYSNPYAQKYHARLAAQYLVYAVQSVATVPCNMAAVLMEGQRLMGRSAQYIAAIDPNGVETLSEKIAMIACAGCARKDYRPVTQEGMTQLVGLTIALLRSKSHDIHCAAEKVQRRAVLVATLLLKVPDTPLSDIHRFLLGPYYSLSNGQNLQARLTEFVKYLSVAQRDDAAARTVIRNIERWADGLYRTEQDLLIAAIKARSLFASDMLHWIKGVTEILLAVANTPACDRHSQEKIRKHALQLIGSLSFILSEDEDTVIFVEGFRMTEILFEAADAAHEHDCDEVVNRIEKILASWAFHGGKYQTGWSILERGLCALAVFAIMRGKDFSELKNMVAARLADKSAPEQGIRDYAARSIMKRAVSPGRHEHWSSFIGMAIARADPEKLGPLLEEIAGMLSSSVVHKDPPMA